MIRTKFNYLTDVIEIDEEGKVYKAEPEGLTSFSDAIPLWRIFGLTYGIYDGDKKLSTVHCSPRGRITIYKDDRVVKYRTRVKSSKKLSIREDGRKVAVVRIGIARVELEKYDYTEDKAKEIACGYAARLRYLLNT